MNHERLDLWKTQSAGGNGNTPRERILSVFVITAGDFVFALVRALIATETRQLF